jgi:hypothetical protein
MPNSAWCTTTKAIACSGFRTVRTSGEVENGVRGEAGRPRAAALDRAVPERPDAVPLERDAEQGEQGRKSQAWYLARKPLAPGGLAAPHKHAGTDVGSRSSWFGLAWCLVCLTIQ